MARKRYDLSRGSALYGELLGEYGARSLGGRKYQLHGQFASGAQIAALMAESFSGGLRAYQSPTSGRILPIDPMLKIMQLLEDEVPSNEWGDIPKKLRKQKRKIVEIPNLIEVTMDVEFPVGFFGELSNVKGAMRRFGILMRRRTMVSDALSAEIEEWAKSKIPEVQAVIAEVIKSRVYEKPVELIRYFRRGKPTEPTPFPQREPTWGLLRAFTEGVKANAYGITFGVNEELAPYWLWVERGHRVILPVPDGDGGYQMMETGTFVKGRPFVEAIGEAVQKFLDEIIEQFQWDVLYNAGHSIARWVTYGNWDLQTEGLPKTVKYIPKTGYGEDFLRYVGLI